MTRIAIALAIAAVVCLGGYLGVEKLTQQAREVGEASVSLRVQAEAASATSEAHERYIGALLALEAEQKRRDIEVTSYEDELMRLRDEVAKQDAADIVVFDGRWSAWLRGDGPKPDVAGGGAGH